ncbi:hypothetical protein HK099_003044, partial [Clydaea vesicula]
MADAIPVISAQFSRGEVFSHLEAFDTFVTTSKLYGLFQDTFAIMTSFNKLASSHQIQCRITFKVSDDWSVVKQHAYRAWLIQFFRVYEQADLQREKLLSSFTKQISSAQQFYAYLCSLTQGIPHSDQLQHDLQWAFIRGVHPAISQMVQSHYDDLCGDQQTNNRFLNNVQWNKVLHKAYTLDATHG